MDGDALGGRLTKEWRRGSQSSHLFASDVLIARKLEQEVLCLIVDRLVDVRQEPLVPFCRDISGFLFLEGWEEIEWEKEGFASADGGQQSAPGDIARKSRVRSDSRRTSVMVSFKTAGQGQSNSFAIFSSPFRYLGRRLFPLPSLAGAGGGSPGREEGFITLLDPFLAQLRHPVLQSSKGEVALGQGCDRSLDERKTYHQLGIR